MQKLMNRLRNARLVLRHSRPLTKVVALCVVVFSTLALLTLQDAIVDSRARAAKLAEQAIALEQENEELRSQIEGVDSVEAIQRIAEEELELVDPDSVIIKVEPQQ